MNLDKYQLLILRFDDKQDAKNSIKTLKDLKKDGSVSYKDAVAVYKNKKGKVKLLQTKEKRGFWTGGTAGLIAGLVLGGPIVGAALGSLVGGFAAKGLNNKDLKHAFDELGDDESALVVVVKEADYGTVINAFPNATGILYREVIENELLIAVEEADDKLGTAMAVVAAVDENSDDEDDDE